eukprot:5267907-Amphidinium_carterae.1
MLDDTPGTVLDDDATAARPRPFRRPVHIADVQIWTPQGLTITLDVRIAKRPPGHHPALCPARDTEEARIWPAWGSDH